MNRLLVTTAVALIALTDAAAAQSVLERVMAKVDGTNISPVNGTFANIAENVAILDADGNILNSIDGSISNTMSGIETSTANVGETVFALDQVTVDLGDMATTVLGAVNTGDITLGTNQDVSEAIAGTSSAVSAKINQLGGAGDTGALVLNVAHNATDVIGSVKNTFTALNGSVGDVSTTVLGAVNTGTITSGVNASVSGLKAHVIGAN